MTLLINGSAVAVPGVRIVPPRAEPWIKLVRGEERELPVTQAIVHKTIADDPEQIDPSPGPTARFGGAEDTIRNWLEKLKSGTQLVTGHDGTVVQTEDLATFVGYHAHTANERSFGIEIKEHVGGRVHLAALQSSLSVVLVACSHLGIQWQCPIRYREGKPLARFSDGRGGADLVGIFGHRDTTGKRGYHDPGDAWFGMARARGVEAFDFARGQDLDVWSTRQEWLVKEGVYAGAIDGIPGPRTTAALAQLGYPDGIFGRHHELAESPPLPRL